MAGGAQEEAQVKKTNLLLGTAAVGLLITGAIAQTSSSIERIKDPAAHQDAEPKKNVRTVYPNTQNAEQAIQQSKSARGGADASKQQPGDVTPLSTAQQSSAPIGGKATPPAQSQQSVQTPSKQPNAPAASTSQTTSSAQQTPAPAAQTTPAAGQPASAQTAKPVEPSNAAAAAPQQSAPTATAQQSASQASQPSHQGSTGVVALNTQQQTTIGETIAHHNVKPITNVSFSIAVGTKMPTAVQLRALPSDIATLIPQYRGYSYVVVEEQIVVVDPGSHEIVAIVPYTAAAPATRLVESPAPAKHTAEKKKPHAPVAQKPMVSRSVNLHTDEKRQARRPATEKRRTTRSVAKREYREEHAPRAATVEEYADPNPVRVLRSPRFVDEEDDADVAPRQGGFFGFFR